MSTDTSAAAVRDQGREQAERADLGPAFERKRHVPAQDQQLAEGVDLDRPRPGFEVTGIVGGRQRAVLDQCPRVVGFDAGVERARRQPRHRDGSQP
ncbi:MAG: hypothetical protein MZW92_46170 [Comamonadaceae bacterium]|nr:hypothetical protein [Comamonadaceae bacterium]